MMTVAHAQRNIGVESPAGGLTVAGRYRLVALIAAGGMGRVWRAHDELLERTVAVKEVLPPAGLPASSRAEAVQRTVQEARAAARLDHRNVVRIFDVVRATGRSWIVMEYIPSRSLHEVVSADGPMTHQQAARIALAVLDALSAAHRAGVLHRDVKPQNVLLGEDGRVVLTDFGLATIGGHRAERGEPVVGSPHYVAPERLRHGVSTQQTDLWSLGATLYTAVEGRTPFARPTVNESLSAVLAGVPDPPRHPGALHAIIGGLLTVDPADRPGAGDVRVALQEVARGAVGIHAAPVPGIVRPRRWRVLAGAGAAAIAVAGAGAVAVLWTGGTEPAAPAPSVAAAAPVTGPCGGAAPEPLRSTAAGAPISLPEGWVWHADPLGFALPVPRGWERSTAGSAVCFSNPGDARSFTVEPGGPLSGRPLQHWQDAEQSALRLGTLPGYRKVSMGPLLVNGGGADWDYTWQPGTGAQLRVYRMLRAAGADRSYALTWTTRAADWDLDRANQRLLLAGFRDPARPAATWSIPTPR
ncbi:serine/threonine-protein kinase [Actinoplanes sp. TFC3]|uniref:serine/threonine-protein kinase n=1 Tax=Actinoplanes sp. TFC3 TaxID=1710355 RepID=UPI0009E92F0D|nr:serine/threonine-protein kinase [Actinoplanes sp. TFC3]